MFLNVWDFSAVGIAFCFLFVCIRFDVILDNVGGDTEQWAMGLLKPWSGAKYVTLVSPLLLNTDSMGLVDGTFQAGCALHNKAFEVNMRKCKIVHCHISLKVID